MPFGFFAKKQAEMRRKANLGKFIGESKSNIE